MQNINHVWDDEMGWASGKKVLSWGLLKQEHLDTWRPLSKGQQKLISWQAAV